MDVFLGDVRKLFGDDNGVGTTAERTAVLGCLLGVGHRYVDDIPQDGGYGGAGMTARLRTTARRTVQVCLPLT